MNKPFQFSMSWLFYGVAWFCVAAWSMSALVKNGVHEFPFLPLLCVTFVGGIYGAIGGKAMAGALVAAIVAIAIDSLMPVVH
jgi:hypothetical protein